MLMLMYATRNVYHLAGHTALDNFKYSEMTGEKFVEFKVLIKKALPPSITGVGSYSPPPSPTSKE